MVTYNYPALLCVTNTLNCLCKVLTPQEHFLKDSVQMEREELFPSSLSFSYPSPLRPPPPPLRVLPNEALLFSMWVSYRVSAASRHQSGCL